MLRVPDQKVMAPTGPRDTDRDTSFFYDTIEATCLTFDTNTGRERILFIQFFTTMCAPIDGEVFFFKRR
jgi:hypothetical protein